MPLRVMTGITRSTAGISQNSFPQILLREGVGGARGMVSDGVRAPQGSQCISSPRPPAHLCPPDGYQVAGE